MKDYQIKKVWIDPRVKDHPLVNQILERVKEAEITLTSLQYFCMESPDVWERVMGFSPRSSSHFEYLFEQHCKKVLEK